MKKIKNYYKEPAYIHYSNCHEDTDFALAHIIGKPQSILTVASGLDNALAFLLLEPQEVVAIDFNITQIHLCRLKKCGIQQLAYEDFLTLLGIGCGDPQGIYNRIRAHLEPDTREYFDSHLFLITQVGLVNCGRFEYYFQFFKKHILSKTHSPKVIRSFMSAATLEEQQEIYKNKFNNLRFRLLFKVFFSQAVMQRLGRDKDYFRYADDDLASLLKRKFDICVNNNLNKENPYLQYIVNGKMDTLPTYLEKENFHKIKENIHRLEIKFAPFDVQIKGGKTYDFMYLSDIFEYMDEKTTGALSRDIDRALNPKGQVLLYNMMIERHLQGNFTETELDQTTNRTCYYCHCYRYEKD